METITITLSSCESGYTPSLVPSPPHINASSSSTSSMEMLVFEVTIAGNVASLVPSPTQLHINAFSTSNMETLVFEVTIAVVDN